MNNGNLRLFSVGHSNHESERFILLLREAGITAIADVRSRPYSQRLPHFNREELQRTLRAADLAYAFLGDTLGGRPGPPSLYDADGLVNYERVRATAAFRQGLERLCRATKNYRVAMMCSEEDPLDCHRGLMITPALAACGVQPGHLRKDGRIETTAEMEARLLAETGIGSGILDGLFAALVSEEERQRLLAEAYRAQARRKAFRLVRGEADTQAGNHEEPS